MSAPPNELPIPPVALSHPSVELLRIWGANGKQHCVLRIGFWEKQGADELKAWGMMLADVLHHIANGYASEHGEDQGKVLRIVRESFETEMNYPTSERLGEFLGEPNDERD